MGGFLGYGPRLSVPAKTGRHNWVPFSPDCDLLNLLTRGDRTAVGGVGAGARRDELGVRVRAAARARRGRAAPGRAVRRQGRGWCSPWYPRTLIADLGVQANPCGGGGGGGALVSRAHDAQPAAGCGTGAGAARGAGQHAGGQALRALVQRLTAMTKVANRDGRGFRVGDELFAAVSRRPPIPSTRLQPVPKATRTTRQFGIRPSFKDHSLSRRAQP